MGLQPIKLRDFLNARHAASNRNLPLLHTTQSSRLVDILNQGRLLATQCNIFKGESLCYLFVGRPSYKYEIPGEAPYWMLPTTFVIRFQTMPTFKRIYPFDSGAFTHKKLPDYITTFGRDDFEFGPDIDYASTLISTFFRTERRYMLRQPSSDQDFRDAHGLGPLHMQIEALNRLYGDRSNDFDDRAAAIELQLDQAIPLNPADVLGVVVPDEFMRDATFAAAIGAITPNVETFGVHPISATMYFGLIYDAVQRIYSRFGIMT